MHFYAYNSCISADVKLSLHHFLLNDYQSFASLLILLLRGFRYSQIINLGIHRTWRTDGKTMIPAERYGNEGELLR